MNGTGRKKYCAIVGFVVYPSNKQDKLQLLIKSKRSSLIPIIGTVPTIITTIFSGGEEEQIHRICSFWGRGTFAIVSCIRLLVCTQPIAKRLLIAPVIYEFIFTHTHDHPPIYTMCFNWTNDLLPISKASPERWRCSHTRYQTVMPDVTKCSIFRLGQ